MNPLLAAYPRLALKGLLLRIFCHSSLYVLHVLLVMAYIHVKRYTSQALIFLIHGLTQARVWFNVAMISDRLSFPSVEIDEIYSLTLPWWKSLCRMTSRYLGLSPNDQWRQRRKGLGTRLVSGKF